MHEQSAVHLADGYYRASGEPMLAFTSIGPGATNTVIGMATAYVDSTAVALFTGSPHTYMRGHGMLQELERRHVADNPRLFEPVVKEWWQPSRVDELPFVLHRAWNAMRTGRPGPVLLDIPMDVQAEAAEVTLPDPEQREATGRLRPDADAVERAARLLARCEAPGDRRRGRRHQRRGDRRAAGPGRAARRAGGHHLERQGRHRRDPPAGRPDDRRHRLHHRQHAGVDRRRAAQRRQPVRRLVRVLVAQGRDLRDPAHEAHPARDRRPRDRQELPGRGAAAGRRARRHCATCSTPSARAGRTRPTATRSRSFAPRGRSRSR